MSNLQPIVAFWFCHLDRSNFTTSILQQTESLLFLSRLRLTGCLIISQMSHSKKICPFNFGILIDSQSKVDHLDM